MAQKSHKNHAPDRELTDVPPADQNPPPEGAPPPQTEASVLAEKLAEALKAAEQMKDQLLRKAAEFENYKRRTEAEYANLIRSANENLLLALLPVLDDLSRSLKPGKETPDFDAFYRGIELIQNKLIRTLEGEGLVAFDSTGKPFDVEFHDALLMVPRTDVPPHTVVEEVERGYMLNDRVLRHAKVIVSTDSETAGMGGAEGTDEDADG
jgi:molecular chaperone GrpE